MDSTRFSNLIFYPPEVLAGDSPSKKGNLWTLGMILCFLLDGHYPKFGLLDIHKKNIPEFSLPIMSLSMELIQMVKNLLNRDPKKRKEMEIGNWKSEDSDSLIKNEEQKQHIKSKIECSWMSRNSCHNFIHFFQKKTNFLHLYYMDKKKYEIVSLKNFVIPGGAGQARILYQLYLTGGCTQDGKNLLKETFQFDSFKKEMIQRANMKYAKIGHRLIQGDGPIFYSIGGIGLRSEHLNICEKYEMTPKDVWTLVGQLNEKKSSINGCNFNNQYIYIFGGVSIHDKSIVYSSIIERMQLSSEKEFWQMLSIEVPEEWIPKCNIGVTQISKQQILLFGGSINESENSKSIFIFEPNNETLLYQIDSSLKGNASFCEEGEIRDDMLFQFSSPFTGEIHFCNLTNLQWEKIQVN